MSGDRFDRVPTSGAAVSRTSILEWWDDRFGISPATFEPYTFWERGAGKLWIVHGDAPDPVAIEALGMTVLRTGGHDWKPTTSAVMRFGHLATENVIVLDRNNAARFVRGEPQSVDWTGDRGYVIVATALLDERVVLGVGQHLDGELRSNVPKGRQRDLLMGSDGEQSGSF